MPMKALPAFISCSSLTAPTANVPLHSRLLPTSSALPFPPPQSCNNLRFRRYSPVLHVTFHEQQKTQNEDATGASETKSKTASNNDDAISSSDFDNTLLVETRKPDSEPNGSSNETTDQDKDPKILGMPPRAVIALNIVAIIFGSQHPIIKMVVDDGSGGGAGPFTLLRFGIGAIIASVPLLFQERTEADNAVHQSTTIGASSTACDDTNDNLKTVWKWGAEIGLWLFLGFAFQAIGLATTTAQRSGFLLYLNVKLVPFFTFILFGREISTPTWVSALIAFTGTALLAYDGTSWNINQGDLWSVAAAAASAMYIIRIGDASREVGDNSLQLNAACLWIVTLLSGIWSLSTASASGTSLIQQLVSISTSHPVEIFYLSAVTTALSNYIQTKSQRDVSPERASVIYSMDPVYGAIFSNLLLGETLTSLGLVGAGMITAAAATNAFLDLNSSAGGEENRAETSDEKKRQ